MDVIQQLLEWAATNDEPITISCDDGFKTYVPRKDAAKWAAFDSDEQHKGDLFFSIGEPTVGHLTVDGTLFAEALAHDPKAIVCEDVSPQRKEIAASMTAMMSDGYSFNRDNMAYVLGIEVDDYDNTWELDEDLWSRLADLIERGAKVVE